jgi:hypothetical protein
VQLLAGALTLRTCMVQVWDASTVLVRYLQHAGVSLAGKRLVDLGSGMLTGAHHHAQPHA